MRGDRCLRGAHGDSEVAQRALPPRPVGLQSRIHDEDSIVRTRFQTIARQNDRRIKGVFLPLQKQSSDISCLFRCVGLVARDPTRQLGRCLDRVLVQQQVAVVAEPEVARMRQLVNRAVPRKGQQDLRIGSGDPRGVIQHYDAV